MGRKLKEHWREFKRGKPGRRFQDRYERTQRGRRSKPAYVRGLRILLAIALFIVGVVLVFIPGPAFVFLGISAGIAADYSQTIASLLDRVELTGRSAFRRARKWWTSSSALARSSLLGAGCAFAVTAGYLAWQLFLVD